VEVSLDDVRAEALLMLDGVAEGDPLDEQTAALIALAVCVAPTVLDMEGTRAYAESALDAGATPEQIHEVLLLVAGLGFHTLAEGSRCIAETLRRRGQGPPALDDRRAQLWKEHVAGDPYWDRLEAETPGFLEALLRLSPEGFQGFFAFSAVPWRTRALRARVKELVCMAADATPTHRYLPGVRLHLANAVDLGAGRASILAALDIAAAAPPHRGVGNVPKESSRQREG
jgi:alkylhydroperoxidase/carboxymuconolactone decarboxylase family protein YurZ